MNEVKMRGQGRGLGKAPSLSFSILQVVREAKGLTYLNRVNR